VKETTAISPSKGAGKKRPSPGDGLSLSCQTILRILTQVRFQRIAVARFLQAFDSSLLDLTDTFFGKIVFLSDLLDGNTILTVQSEISVNDFGFTGAQ